MARPGACVYRGSVVSSAVRSFWAEPPVADPPARVWRDWALLAVIMVAAVLENIFREDLIWSPAGLIVCVGGALTLLWRRTHPLLVTLVTFSGLLLLDSLDRVIAEEPAATLYSSLYVLVLPYALFRWGSGRDATIGMAFILAGAVVSEVLLGTIADALVSVPVLLLPAELGAAVRYRTRSRLREREQIALREREQLARELHDTVAHHVSAIAVRAQAGRTLAATRPAAAVEALEVIEDAASRTLTELRAIVGALRNGAEPDLVPQRGVADIARLAGTTDGPRVDVELSGDLDGLRPMVGAAIYRIAQESITNAVRHARHATQIAVRVSGEDDCVRLVVRDDGEATAAASPGYGLAGMTERAALLGGTLEAGPNSGRGWTVTAVLPRNGA
jgi:signal transduction histidine kinase